MASIFPSKPLGFGLMRLPRVGGMIDPTQTERMVDTFLERGFSYFDTAYVYEGSEEAFRHTVSMRHPRERYLLADKLAGWALSKDFPPEKMFEASLARSGAGYFDYYLLHSLQADNLRAYEENGCWAFARRMREAGRIRHLGFSFHDSPELLERILSDHPEFEFVQLQVNYADWESETVHARRNVEVARRHGIEIVVMEPVKGGILANLPPDAVEVLRTTRPNASVASWAMRFAATLPGVSMVLSGMSSQAQLEDNLRTFDPIQPFTEEERAALWRAREILLSGETIACTSCRYCTAGCPAHIDIPRVFQAMNMLLTFGEHSRPHSTYARLLAAGSGRAQDCVACGHCEGICPQHLPIISLLQNASMQLD